MAEVARRRGVGEHAPLRVVSLFIEAGLGAARPLLLLRLPPAPMLLLCPRSALGRRSRSDDARGGPSSSNRCDSQHSDANRSGFWRADDGGVVAGRVVGRRVSVRSTREGSAAKIIPKS